MTNSEAATLLRELAQEIEAGGRVEASASSWSVGVNPMQPIKMELQYKFRKKELEIQFKFKESLDISIFLIAATSVLKIQAFS